MVERKSRRFRPLLTGVTAAAILAALLSPAGTATADDQPWRNAQQTPEQRAGELLGAMTLADKVSMLHGVSQSLSPVPTVGYLPPIERLGVPGITMTDGPAGVRNGNKATELPAPISQGASFDPAVAAQYGAVLGTDARDLGQDQLFGPGMNIARVPTNGRNFEYFSEDPLLSGTIGGANVQGIQSQGVIATVKHYVGNNQETNRMSVSANVDDRTLHEIYEKNFGVAVADGKPGSVMCSYNRVNDVYACGNSATLITALRQQFGFDGYVVSDYPATHTTADIAAGLNVELPTGIHETLVQVQAAIADGSLSQAVVDQRVRETLTVLFRFGLFDRDTTATSPIDQNADNASAQAIAEQSAVLLKNSGNILPVTPDTASVAVIGTTAKTSAQGGGSSQVNPLSVDNAYDAIVARAGTATKVSYADGADLTAAAATAKAAQTAFVFVRDRSSEGSDRANLSLPDNQDALISAVAAANPHTVVVLETGAPALMPWLPQVSGVLEAWYPGARGGAAIARVLWGDVNPSGKLPQTWPARGSDVPANTPQQYPGVGGEETYSEGVNVGYRWYDQNNVDPLFPFGAGLSYTGFQYKNLKLGKKSGNSGEDVTLSFDLTNTGSRAGAEAPQVYVSKPQTTVASPPRELGAFTKVSLAPHETKHVSLTVKSRELSYWDSGAQAFTVQDGAYGISVGGSSRSLPLSASYTVKRSDGPVRLQSSSVSKPVSPGSSFTVDSTIENASDYAEKGATVAVTAPQGWTVIPLTVTKFPTIGTKLRAITSFKVTVPSNAPAGPSSLTVTATGTVNGVGKSTANTVALSVPYASTTAALNTVGVTSNADPAPGNFDTGGYSYSAENLAKVGVTPGGQVQVGGVSTTFPPQAPGTPDVITAHGQSITFPGKGSQLVLLGAATFGEIKATVTVTYTDGTTTAVPVDFNDWYSNAATGGGSVVATSQWNQPPGGIGAHDVSIYGQLSPIDAAKTIAYLTLPDSANLHFFTIATQ
jgi:beta-glucosidase